MEGEDGGIDLLSDGISDSEDGVDGGEFICVEI